MKKISLPVVFIGLGAITSFSARADEPSTSSVSLEVGADVVSSYIWRGQELGGFSVQPSMTLSFDKAHLSLGVWASAELFERTSVLNMTEFDWSLTWNPIEPLTIALCDYFMSYAAGPTYFGEWNFSSSSSHCLEAQLAYDFGPVALSWNTCLTGPDHSVDGGGKLKRNYSTYVEASAPFTVAGVECSAAVGANLWKGEFTAAGNEGFNVCNISLSAKKEVWKLPLTGQLVFNPQSDNAYFVVGLSF